MALDHTLHWPDIGSYIGVLNSLAGRKTELKNDIVGAVEQLDSDYARVTILPPFISNMNSAVNSVSAGEANLVTAINDYHLNVLKSELPSTASTVSGVIDDLIVAMNGYAPAQTFMANGNFHSLYRDRLGRNDVPTAPSGSNTVDDSLGD